VRTGITPASASVDPATLAARLAGAGFTRVTVEVEEDRFRFAAIAPGG
jgi:hypothetical protein